MHNVNETMCLCVRACTCLCVHVCTRACTYVRAHACRCESVFASACLHHSPLEFSVTFLFCSVWLQKLVAKGTNKGYKTVNNRCSLFRRRGGRFTQHRCMTGPHRGAVPLSIYSSHVRSFVFTLRTSNQSLVTLYWLPNKVSKVSFSASEKTWGRSPSQSWGPLHLDYSIRDQI